MAHTPGPWFADCDSVLATLPGGAVVEIARTNVLQELDTHTEYANARLIAAAPELLEALEWYADQFCEMGASSGFCGRLSDVECSGCRARAAIAALQSPPVEQPAQAEGGE